VFNLILLAGAMIAYSSGVMENKNWSYGAEIALRHMIGTGVFFTSPFDRVCVRFVKTRGLRLTTISRGNDAPFPLGIVDRGWITGRYNKQ
jgi:hypothetical protein